MSTQVSGASDPAGQASLPGIVTQPAAGDAESSAGSKPASTKAEQPKPTASMLSVPAPEKKEEQGAQSGGSKDGKPADAGELTIAVPEGVEIEKEALDAFKSFAKENGMSGELASKLLAWNTERTKVSEAVWQKQGQDWFNELERDPDFGGKNLEASQSSVRRAVARFFDDKTLADITRFGFDNHPGLVKALKRIGDSIKEDDSSTGSGAGNGASRSALDRDAQLRTDYPSMFSEQK
jgi:hypothetical protein